MDIEWYNKAKDLSVKEQWSELYKQEKEKLQEKETSIWLQNKDINMYAGMTKEWLKILFKDLNIKSVIDYGCSDCKWQSTFDWSNISYTGIDIVPEIVQYNKDNYSDCNMSFTIGNLIDDIPEQVDLIMVRNVFLHLQLRDIMKCLNNIKKSKSKYLLASTDFNIHKNIDTIALWATRRNLSIKPFSLPQPKMLLPEIKLDQLKRRSANIYLGLWYIEDVPYFNLEELDKIQKEAERI